MVSTPNNSRKRSFVSWKEEKEDDRDHRICLTLRYISIHLNGRLEQKTETFSVHATSSHGDFKWILMTQSAEAATSLQSDGVFFSCELELAITDTCYSAPIKLEIYTSHVTKHWKIHEVQLFEERARHNQRLMSSN